jgi:restriction system protein
MAMGRKRARQQALWIATEELARTGGHAFYERFSFDIQQPARSMSGIFERLVVEVLLKMGYGGSRKDAGQAMGPSGDEGIDGIISEDRLGLDLVYLQAKKWDGTVGRPEIQRFVGALHGKRAKKGVFITTGSFSSEAVAYAAQIDPKVVLIDGRYLADLMIDFDVGVSTVATYHVKRVDSDYFDET